MSENHPRRWPVLWTLISLMVLMLVAGCSKVTQQSYDKLKVGMNYEDVVIILGEPTHCDSALSARSCTWGAADKSIDGQFIAGKLIIFSSKGL